MSGGRPIYENDADLGNEREVAKQFGEHWKCEVVCIRLSDGLYSMKFPPLVKFKTVMAGRRDRGDPGDVEPCTLFPMPNFKKLG